MKLRRLLTTACLATSLAGGCGDSETTPAPDAGMAAGGAGGMAAGGVGGMAAGGAGGAGPSASRNTVDLVFEGAITATLRGMGGTCGGAPGGASVQVNASEFGVSPPFTLGVVILDESDWDRPPTVLNFMGMPRTSYTWRTGTPGTVRVARDRSLAEFDVELAEVAGSGRVRVKGTVRCAR